MIHKKKVRNNLFSRTPMGKFLTPIGKFFPAQHFGVDSIPFLVPSSSLDGLCRVLVTPNCSWIFGSAQLCDSTVKMVSFLLRKFVEENFSFSWGTGIISDSSVVASGSGTLDMSSSLFWTAELTFWSLFCEYCQLWNRLLWTGVSDLPTFYEIKVDRPPFGKKRGRFLCSENIGLFYLSVTQNEPIFFCFDITKQQRYNKTGTK